MTGIIVWPVVSVEAFSESTKREFRSAQSKVKKMVGGSEMKQLVEITRDVLHENKVLGTLSEGRLHPPDWDVEGGVKVLNLRK